MASKSAERCANRTRLDFLQDIIVLAGEGEQKLLVHKNIACETSHYFQSALNGPWKEASENIIRLPDFDAKIFGIYVGWLYTSKVDVTGQADIEYDTLADDDQLSELHGDLIDAYKLAEYIQDTAFRNAVVDELVKIIESTNKFLHESNVKYFWEDGNHNPKLAKLFIDYYASDYPSDLFDEVVMDLPSDLTAAIAKTCVAEGGVKLASRKPRYRPKCYYHDHEDEAAKEKCK